MLKLSEILVALTMLGEADIQDLDPNEVACLAQNIYHEARGEDPVGQSAVAHVTLNRVNSPAYPDTVCGVVYQPRQFSWTAHAPLKVSEPAAFENATMVAIITLQGWSSDPTDGATHYFDHKRVTPGWSRVFETTRVIGGHKFMRGG